MPRLVDYGARFAFLLEAAFEVVLTHGVDALSRQSVANVLGVSASTVRRLVAADADLVVLAAEEVALRRRRDRWNVVGGTPRQRAVDLLCSLVPDTDARVAEETVWWRIVFSTRLGPGADRVPLPTGSLRQRYQVALSGYADDSTHDVQGGGAEISAELTKVADARAADVDAALASVVSLLEVPDHERAQALDDLRVLIDGVGVAVCLGRLSPAEAVRVLERAVHRSAPSEDG